MTENTVKPQSSMGVLTLASIIMLMSALFVSLPGAAQTVSEAQRQQLENLTPAQKQRLIQALGGSLSTENSEPSVQSSEPQFGPAETSEESEQGDEERIQFEPLDYLVVEMNADEEQRRDLLVEVDRALGRNFYQIDSNGRLDFPGAGSVILAGLTERQAELRLSAVPALRTVYLQVSRLPVTATGTASLEPYGYELFQGVPTTFAPATDIPVPVDYTLGAGDELSLLIFGQYNAKHTLVVGRDGSINVPEIGPVQVAGMRFEQARDELAKRVSSRYIGVEMSLTLGALKSIQVFVLGDVTRPGSYTVSSLSTMTNALLVSGGIANTGSLRNVQLKRNNRVVGRLDLYDLLLNGNTKSDRRLNSGDAIFVPPVSKQVSVYGQVKRPAIYELKNESSIGEVIALAGGLLPNAYKREVRVEKFGHNGNKSIVVADLRGDNQIRIGAGDQVEVLRALDKLTDAVYLKGHVDREATLQWRSGMRLLDAIPQAELFEIQSDQQYLLIRRENQRTGRITLLSANWLNARSNPASSDNLALNKGDTIHVFSLDSDRSARISPLVDELRRQADNDNALQTVFVHGRVRSKGEYPYHQNMRVSDLLRASGGIGDNAYLEGAELTRTDETSGRYSTRHISISLRGLVPGSATDEILVPGDVLTVKEIPLWREKQRIELSGEIEFPGSYSVSRGERLSEVIRRAGGLTDMAFAGGSVFLREDLREREREQIAQLAGRVRAEVSGISGDQEEARFRAESLLDQLEKTEAVGRLVIDLQLAMSGDTQHDVILEDGDRLVVPRVSQEVTVIGEVQYPTSHIYDSQLDQAAYIAKSGGVTSNAAVKRIYVIRADGQVVAQQGSNWFRRSGAAVEARPGDTIVVPLNADRISSLSLWTSVTRIVYNIGVAAAAVASF